jgi:hypothetical protein
MTDWEHVKRLGGRGILKRYDIKDLKAQRNRVLWLMLDGLWHTATEIINFSQGREGLRRMRELREIPHVTIHRRRAAKKREFMYRLEYTPPQGELF